MAEEKSPTQRRNAQIEQDRETMRSRVDVFALLADIAAGHCVAEYEPRAHANQKHPKVKRLVQPNLDQRLRAAELIAQRLVPSLRAVDISDGGNGPMKISVEVPFAMPGHERVIEGEIEREVDKKIGLLNQTIEDAVMADDEEGGSYV